MRTELVHADDQDGLVDLESQRLGLDEVEGLAVDLDKSFTGLYISAQYTVSRACGRGVGGVPCSGRQLFTRLATILTLRAAGAGKSGAYQSRSSSCRSIARSGKPCWATVGCVRWEVWVRLFACRRRRRCPGAVVGRREFKRALAGLGWTVAQALCRVTSASILCKTALE